jgi:hypothetical protein
MDAVGAGVAEYFSVLLGAVAVALTIVAVAARCAARAHRSGAVGAPSYGRVLAYNTATR